MFGHRKAGSLLFQISGRIRLRFSAEPITYHNQQHRHHGHDARGRAEGARGDHGQAKMVLKSVVPGWYELPAMLRQERIMEKLKEESWGYKAKKDESM